MKIKSVVDESEQLQLAIQMIKLGARLQLLESVTTLSRERLIKLYKELQGISPPKGMLPFSTDWFLTWRPNIHSSVFMNIYNFILKNTDVRDVHALIKSYQLYLEQMRDDNAEEVEPVLTLTRAWTLLRFVECRMMKLTYCTCCAGKFVVNSDDLNHSHVCGLCHVPSRAGKTKKSKEDNLKAIQMAA
jgi:flagellar transcriptional activator FlhC